ncbi:hypothetical protein FRC07_014382 [Ceratobasidium sp. 392]|nr:hypothetical protein FRC07_014382 [Ceratobasidium sp. 392]
MKRFPGGWITEQIMKRQLRNKRDTMTRLSKRAESLKIKPISILASKTQASSKSRDRAQEQRIIAPKPPPATKTSARNINSQAKVAKQARKLVEKPAQPAKSAATSKSTGQKRTHKSDSESDSSHENDGGDSDKEDGDDNWDKQVDEQLTRLGHGGADSTAAGAQPADGPSTASSSTKPPTKRPRPKMRPPPTSDSDPEAAPTNLKGKEPAQGLKAKAANKDKGKGKAFTGSKATPQKRKTRAK